MEALEKAIKDLGFDKIKPKQRKAIEAFVSVNDVFVSLPTVYGKSIIYVIIPKLFEKFQNLSLCQTMLEG